MSPAWFPSLVDWCGCGDGCHWPDTPPSYSRDDGPPDPPEWTVLLVVGVGLVCEVVLSLWIDAHIRGVL